MNSEIDHGVEGFGSDNASAVVAQARSEQTKPFTLNQTGKPKELMSGDNDCIYELDGDTLKVAMNALCPGRPKGFNAKDSPPRPQRPRLGDRTRPRKAEG